MNKHSVFRIVLVGSFVNGLIVLLQIAGGLVTARILGPEGRGQLAAIQLWPTYLVTFGSLGITNATAFYCGRNPDRAPAIIATAWVALVSLAIPLMALGYWIMPFVLARQTSQSIHLARVLLLLIPIQFAGSLPFYSLQGLGRFRVWNLVRVQFALLWLAVQGLAWWLKAATVPFLAYSYLAIMSIHCISWMIAQFRSVPGSYRPEGKLARELLAFGVPTAASSAPQQLNLRLDQGFMAAFLPSKTLGLYTAAVAVGGMASPFLTAISQTILPYLTAFGDSSGQGLRAVRVLRLSAGIAAALSAILALATPALMPLAFGRDYSPAIPAAVLLVLAGCFSGLNGIGAETFKGLGEPKAPLVAETAGAVCTVTLLPILLWRYGIVGAAIASIASYAVTYLVYLNRAARRAQIPLRECLLPDRRELRLITDALLKKNTTVAGVI